MRISAILSRTVTRIVTFKAFLAKFFADLKDMLKKLDANAHQNALGKTTGCLYQ